MFSDFTEKILSGCELSGYRDPQEYIYGESRDEKSDSYSYGMMLFETICGKDYFSAAGVPEDEFFMMADPDSDGAVINCGYIPEEYGFLADFFEKTTAWRRSERITPSEALSLLSEFKNDEQPDSSSSENNANEPDEENAPEAQDRYSVCTDYDYGIILNNKRSGRIEFRPLLFFTGETEKYDMPSDKPGRFMIAVSKRHRDFREVTNPSSVYGDVIMPVGLACAEDTDSPSLRISIENSDGKLKVSFLELSADRSETGKQYDVRWVTV